MTANAKLHQLSFLLVLVFLVAGVATSQTVNLFVSSRAGDRISAKPALQFGDEQSSEMPTFEVNDSIHYQAIAGFGASLLEAGLVVLNALPPDEQECYFLRHAPELGKLTGSSDCSEKEVEERMVLAMEA